MTDYVFDGELVQKAFPDWTKSSCVYLAISLNVAMKAGLISPPVYVGRNNLTKKIRAFVTHAECKPEDNERTTYEHWTGQS